ncbi:C40 family peptidase [Pseudooceanicola sp.]|uniref:C40 family peptidase n=1 Tax=Pseudooceanicola sp. TaxID=1914328 RepID=UPI0040598056
MSDRRALKANGRVADLSLKGHLEAERYVAPLTHWVRVPVIPILAEPEGPRDRELAFGEEFEVLEISNGWAFGSAARDGYVGYVQASALTARARSATHRVISPSYWFAAPDLKCPKPPGLLPIGARLAVGALHRDHCDWGEIAQPSGNPDTFAYVPMPTLAPLSPAATDPVEEAERFLGVPYLWGGNSGFGIDCSGLVQAACLACGITCPGDSDQQAQTLGTPLAPAADLQRGDLIFWRGHVALVAGDGRILHANAHHMRVAYEDADTAIARIATKEGPITARRRLPS